MQIIAVFHTTHHTLLAEKIFKKLNIKSKTIMKPRKITTDCGLAIEFDDKFISEVLNEFILAKLKLEGFYNRKENDWEKIDMN